MKNVVRVSWTWVAVAARSAATAGKAGTYMSVARGAIAVRNTTVATNATATLASRVASVGGWSPRYSQSGKTPSTWTLPRALVTPSGTRPFSSAQIVDGQVVVATGWAPPADHCVQSTWRGKVGGVPAETCTGRAPSTDTLLGTLVAPLQRPVWSVGQPGGGQMRGTWQRWRGSAKGQSQRGGRARDAVIGPTKPSP